MGGWAAILKNFPMLESGQNTHEIFPLKNLYVRTKAVSQRERCDQGVYSGNLSVAGNKTRRGSPVDRRPSTAEAKVVSEEIKSLFF